MKAKTILSVLLAVTMLTSAFAACTNGNGTETEGTDATEAETSNITTEGTTEDMSNNTDTEVTTDITTEATTEGTVESTAEVVTVTTETTETEAPLETGALELNKTDYFPEYEGYVETNSKYTGFVNIRIEAEDYTNATMPWTEKYGKEFGGQKLLFALLHGEENFPLGTSGTYYSEYTFTVPESGSYVMMALASANNADWTTDFTLYIDGMEVGNSGRATIKESFPSPTLADDGIMKYLDFGRVDLTEGEHTLKYVAKNSDFNTREWGLRMASFLDYIEFTMDSDTAAYAKISYDVSVSDVEESRVLKNAAKVNVYDARFPLRLQVADIFEEAGEKEYYIEDYFGNKVISGTIQGDTNEFVSVTIGIKNHPTGYFTLKIGKSSQSYVVTPPLNERYEGDSPFAFDFASFLLSDISDTRSLASAARLAGVTWVRERANWADYEKYPGVYDFSSTDKRFNAIKDAGLDILSILYVSPSWATNNLGSGTGHVGAFATTQLQIYKAMEKITSHYSGTVDAWEIWNEPDHGFAKETAELFTAWQKAATLGALAGDPNVIITHGGFCMPNKHPAVEGTTSDYIHLSLMNDLLKYVNVFNYHSHITQRGDLNNYDYRKTLLAKEVYSTMALYGAIDKPIWVTEAGMRMESLTPTQEMKLAQAPYIVTSAIQSFAMETDKHYWFVLSPYIEGDGDFGTFSPELDPYPTLAAQATATNVLGKAEYIGQLKGLQGVSSNGPFGYVFNTGKRIASVLWINEGEPIEYTFDAELPVIITDLMGNETLVQPEDGKITVTVTTNPIYITYSTPPEYIAQTDAKSEKIKPLTFTDAEKVIISPQLVGYDIDDEVSKHEGHVIENGTKILVRITNLNNYAVTGTVTATLDGITFEGNGAEVTVKAFGEAFVTLTLHIDTETGSINEYISFVGEFNGEETSKSAMHVRTATGAIEPKCNFKANVTDAEVYTKEKLKSIAFSISADNINGDLVVMLNGNEIDTYTYNKTMGRLAVDLSSIDAGNYILTVARRTKSGYCDFSHLYVYFDGENVVFSNP